MQVVAGVLPMDLEVFLKAAEYWLRKGDFDKIEELVNRRTENKKQMKDRILEMWQERWDQSPNGRRLHRLLPRVSDRLKMKYLNPSKGLVQFLTGHGPYAQYLYDRELKPTNRCSCGVLGTPEHVLFECVDLRGVADEERLLLQGTEVLHAVANEQNCKVLDILATKISCHLLQVYQSGRVQHGPRPV